MTKNNKRRIFSTAIALAMTSLLFNNPATSEQATTKATTPDETLDAAEEQSIQKTSKESCSDYIYKRKMTNQSDNKNNECPWGPSDKNKKKSSGKSKKKGPNWGM